MCKNDTTFELMNGLAYEIAKMDVEHCVHPMEIEYLWGQARVQLMLTAKINQRKRIDRMSKSQAAEKDEDEVLDEVLYPVRDMSEDQRKLILRILAFSEAQQSESPRAQIGQGSKPPKESSRTKFGNTMHTMRQFFEAIDADDNDDIDPQEFNTLCQRLGLGIDEATAYELFTAFDTDNSGGISYSEFEQSMVDVKADNYYEERRPLPALSQKVQLACGIIEEEGEANAFKLLISVFREALETRLLERTIPRVVTLDELRAFVVNENVDLSALTQIERQNLVNIMERMFFAFMDRPDNKAKVGRVLAADEPLAQDNRQRIKHDMVLWYLRKVLIRLRNDGNVGTFMTGSGAGAGAGAHRDRGGHVVHGERGHGHGHSEGYDMFTEEDDGVFNDSELAFTVGVTLLEKFGLNNKQRRSSMAAAAVKRASVSTRNGNSNASKQRGSQTLGHDRECNYTSRKLHAFERYASRDVVDGKSATQRLLRIDGQCLSKGTTHRVISRDGGQHPPRARVLRRSHAPHAGRACGLAHSLDTCTHGSTHHDTHTHTHTRTHAHTHTRARGGHACMHARKTPHRFPLALYILPPCATAGLDQLVKQLDLRFYGWEVCAHSTHARDPLRTTHERRFMIRSSRRPWRDPPASQHKEGLRCWFGLWSLSQTKGLFLVGGGHI